MKNKKRQKYLTWILQIILALLFLAAGSGKFLAAAIWIEKFSDWGLPENFHILIGAIEMLAAILLLIPKLSKYAALSLVAVMIGAGITHVFNQEAVQLIRPGIFLVFLSTLLYLKRDESK